MGDFFHSYVFFYFPFFWRFEINIVFLQQDKGGALFASFSVKIDIVQIISENE